MSQWLTKEHLTFILGSCSKYKLIFLLRITGLRRPLNALIKIAVGSFIRASLPAKGVAAKQRRLMLRLYFRRSDSGDQRVRRLVTA